MDGWMEFGGCDLSKPLTRPGGGGRMFMRFRNMRHIVRVHVSADGKTWKRFERTFEVSGYHHDVRSRFLFLKPGLFAAGDGEARFRDFRYRVPAAS